MRGKTSVTKRDHLKRFRKTPYPRKQGMSDTAANGSVLKNFQATGRTGRRNAMADVLGEHSTVSTSELPLKLSKLSTSADSSDEEEPEDSATERSNCVSNRETKNATAGSSSTSASAR